MKKLSSGLIFLLLLLVGCAQRGDDAPYDTKESCLNGIYLVSRGDLFGAIDEEEKVLLPVIYDRVEMISDDVFCAYLDDMLFVADRGGNIVGTMPLAECTSDADVLRFYNDGVDDSFNNWEAVLEGYSRLSAICMDKAKSVEEARSQADLVEEMLRSAKGVMSEEQKTRFNKIKNDFKEYRRR